MVVDLAAAMRPMIDDAPRDDGETDRFRREIAFVGHGRELIAESKREDDLRRAWQKRADSVRRRHRSKGTRRMPKEVSKRTVSNFTRELLCVRARHERVGLRSHDEVISMEPADLVGPPGHRDLPPFSE